MISTQLENVRKNSPLVHSLTNYVSANDCANILYAIGAKPVMADDIRDIKDITPNSDALYINLGTLNKTRLTAFIKAGKIANKNNIPVCLDPVGVSASSFRLNSAKYLLKKVKFSVIKGNVTEIKALYFGSKSNSGVDADAHDKITDENIDIFIKLAKDFAKKTGAVIVITGETDIVADKTEAYIIKNGHKMMCNVTGAGCMLGVVLAAFVGANQNTLLLSCVCAVCAMGLCGEKAFERLLQKDGNTAYRNYLIDEIFNLSQADLTKGAKYEIR